MQLPRVIRSVRAIAAPKIVSASARVPARGHPGGRDPEALGLLDLREGVPGLRGGGDDADRWRRGAHREPPKMIAGLISSQRCMRTIALLISSIG